MLKLAQLRGGDMEEMALLLENGGGTSPGPKARLALNKQQA